MRKKTRRMGSPAAAVFSAAMAMAMAIAVATPAEAGVRWRVVTTTDFPSTYDTINSVVATGGDDAWAFGTKDAAFRQGPFALRWTGDAWDFVTLPAQVTGAAGPSSASSSTNVWMVGDEEGQRPYALRWDGTGWAVARTWPEGQITGVSALAPDDVWVFGAPGANFGIGTWHFDGRQWQQSELDFFPATASAVSAGDIWAVGRGADGGSRTVAHYDGTGWQEVQLGDALPPDTSDGDVFQNVFLTDVHTTSATDIWLAGFVSRSDILQTTSTPFVVHGDGRSWKTFPLPGQWLTERLSGDGRGGLWISGTTLEGDPILGHRSARGKWRTTQITSGDTAGNIADFALIPGTTSLWGAGELRPADDSFSNGAVFSHGSTPRRASAPRTPWQATSP